MTRAIRPARCGCFGINVRDDERGNTFLRQHGLREREFLGVVIRTNTPKLNVAGSGDLLNPTRPTPEQQEQDRQRMTKVRELVTAWVRETGLKVF